MAKQKPIKIKPQNRGKLHAATGTPPGKKIPLAKEEKDAHSKNPKLRKEADFALAARKWSHSKKGK